MCPCKPFPRPPPDTPCPPPGSHDTGVTAHRPHGRPALQGGSRVQPSALLPRASAGFPSPPSPWTAAVTGLCTCPCVCVLCVLAEIYGTGTSGPGTGSSSPQHRHRSAVPPGRGGWGTPEPAAGTLPIGPARKRPRGCSGLACSTRASGRLAVRAGDVAGPSPVGRPLTRFSRRPADWGAFSPLSGASRVSPILVLRR